MQRQPDRLALAPGRLNIPRLAAGTNRAHQHADAYSGYEALYRPEPGRSRITHVACWAHCWRKLFDVYEATRSPIAEEGLRRIQELFAIEAEINGGTAERLAERQARSVRLLAALRT
jgi:transposase